MSGCSSTIGPLPLAGGGGGVAELAAFLERAEVENKADMDWRLRLRLWGTRTLCCSSSTDREGSRSCRAPVLGLVLSAARRHDWQVESERLREAIALRCSLTLRGSFAIGLVSRASGCWERGSDISVCIERE